MTDMNITQNTGSYDRNGIPIYVGDLIRVEHYVHRSKRRLMWMYFRVAEIQGRFVVQNWNDLNAAKYQCLLEHCGLRGCEVLAETIRLKDLKGNFITFNERKRIKRIVCGVCGCGQRADSTGYCDDCLGG
jgi:hypothetical protein